MKKSALHRKLLVTAAGERGVAEADISGYTVALVRRALADLTTAGELHGLRLEGRERRYFTDVATAREYEARELGRVTPPESKSRFKSASWEPDAKAVETERTVFTRGPSPSGRTLRANTHAFSN